jgi:putative ABC transport system permease protein
MLLFMLLPSLNLINLNLSRMMERATEIGVRRSFGASINVLIRQFIIENVLISLMAGFLGLLLSYGALYMLNNSGVFANANFSINYRVLGVAVLLSVVFGVVSGVYPAWRMARIHPIYALKGGAK